MKGTPSLNPHVASKALEANKSGIKVAVVTLRCLARTNRGRSFLERAWKLPVNVGCFTMCTIVPSECGWEQIPIYVM